MKVVLFVRKSVCEEKQPMLEALGYAVEPFDEENSIVYYAWPPWSDFSSFPWLLSGGDFLHRNLTILFSPKEGHRYCNKLGQVIPFQDGVVEDITAPMHDPVVFEHRVGTKFIVRYCLVLPEISVEKPKLHFLSVPSGVFCIKRDIFPFPYKFNPTTKPL